MANDISSQKQSYFKPVTLNSERETILNIVARSGALMQVKEESAKSDQVQLTTYKAVSLTGLTLVATKVDGPEISGTPAITIAFEASKTMFFCSGKIVRGNKSDEYFIEIKKIFELQRRDSFRVSISSQIVKARFHVTLLNGGALAKEFKILDLSAGGIGIQVPDENVPLFKPGSTLYGVILVGTHSPVDVKAIVKYQRKGSEGKTTYNHVGCQIVELTQAVSQRIAFLVNDCHRTMFSKIAK